MKQQINEIKRMQLLAGVINESQLNEDILELKQMSKQLYSFLKKKGIKPQLTTRSIMNSGSQMKVGFEKNKTNSGDWDGTLIQVSEKPEEFVSIGLPFVVVGRLLGFNEEKNGPLEGWWKKPELQQWVTTLGNELTKQIKEKYPNMAYQFAGLKDNYWYILNFGYLQTKKGGQKDLSQRPNAPKPAAQPQQESFDNLDEIVDNVLAKLRNK
jgi:hypothetical protein